MRERVELEGNWVKGWNWWWRTCIRWRESGRWTVQASAFSFQICRSMRLNKTPIELSYMPNPIRNYYRLRMAKLTRTHLQRRKRKLAAVHQPVWCTACNGHWSWPPYRLPLWIAPPQYGYRRWRKCSKLLRIPKIQLKNHWYVWRFILQKIRFHIIPQFSAITFIRNFPVGNRHLFFYHLKSHFIIWNFIVTSYCIVWCINTHTHMDPIQGR